MDIGQDHRFQEMLAGYAVLLPLSQAKVHVLNATVAFSTYDFTAQPCAITNSYQLYFTATEAHQWIDSPLVFTRDNGQLGHY